MPSGVLDVLWTAVFLVASHWRCTVCSIMIHRSLYFSEVQKLGRPCSPWRYRFWPYRLDLRSRAEKQEAAQRPSPDTQNTSRPAMTPHRCYKRRRAYTTVRSCWMFMLISYARRVLQTHGKDGYKIPGSTEPGLVSARGGS